MVLYWVEWSGVQVLNMNINMGRALTMISTSRSKRPNSMTTFLIRDGSFFVSIGFPRRGVDSVSSSSTSSVGDDDCKVEQKKMIKE